MLIFGQRDYSMRVWLDPLQMSSRRLSPTDVVRAIEQQNVQVPAGQIGQPPAPPDQVYQYTMTTLGRLSHESQFSEMILKTDAEGRYHFSTIVPAQYPGRPRHIHYRVSHAAHVTLVTQLYFGRERGVAEELVAALKRDDKGISRAVFDVTLNSV